MARRAGAARRVDSAAVQRQADRAQRAAADPAASVWVSASAGTGKTKVLTDRVLALLLAGTGPQRILCLTYTRAAAAEMANRIQGELGRWAAMGEENLAKAVKGLTGSSPGAEALARARGLFAEVLDCPGGLKIQTIHAFCESLLRRFPVEAGLQPHFEVMDELTAREILADARDAVLARALGPSGEEAGPVAEALARVSGRIGIEAFDELMRNLANARGRIARLLDADGGIAGASAGIARCLGIAPGEGEDDVIAAAADRAFDAEALRGCLRALDLGSATDRKRGAAIARFLDADGAARAAMWEDYRTAFLTGEGEPRKTLITNGALRRFKDGDGGAVAEALAAEAGRVVDVEARRRAARTLEGSVAALTLGRELIRTYQARKDVLARLDYDDLILRTRDLLARSGAAQWVLFKLDGGLDHILVDEAQDTSPEQWQVIAALAEEFFAGLGAREGARTVFAVGDAKQSIYGFQGADPDAFEDMRAYFKARIEATAAGFRDVPLHVSFRSTGPVLAAVDAVFARVEARDGVGPPREDIRHETTRIGEAGLVELWPPVAETADRWADPWSPDPDPESGTSAEARLAGLIAARIAEWRGNEWLAARGRPLRAGDVMVLVRRRTGFVDGLVRALKRLRVPVAGVDRMRLADELAVMDLMALGRFLLLPEDDLTLACVLKGPFLGFDDAGLFALAHRREGTLWEALSLRARAEGGAVREARAWLGGLLARTDRDRPFELYASVLDEHDGRRRLLARLGLEAEEPVNEFLERALEYERAAPPSLQGFLAWLDQGQAEIKRDLEQQVRDEVRVMTVHGSKGLQAPVVILPDTMRPPRPPAGPYWRADGAVGPALPLWAPRVDDYDPVLRGLRQDAIDAEAREYRRLLYVALTRAEDRLYVCGWRGRTAPPAGVWYDLIRDGLEGVAEAVDFDFTGDHGAMGWAGPGLRLAASQDPEAAVREDAALAGETTAEAPGWARRPAPAEQGPARPLIPSAAEDEPAVLSPLGGDGGARFLRGRLVHGLLETLPGLAPAAREAAARRFLARPALGLTPALQGEIAAETLAILEDERFAPLFGPASLAEVPVTGAIGGAVVSGQVDRLVVTDDAVLVVDYKTSRPVPDGAEAVPPAHRRQMALYRAALARIFPDREVRCALLYTAGPALIPLPEAALALP